ncbi:MAG: CapA family protein, partial [Clostridiales bacterium]|nr:CapA family protein [Clostridiales bacterium]
QNAKRRMEMEDDDDEEFERLLADETDETLPVALRQAAERIAGAGGDLKNGLQSGVQRMGKFLTARKENDTRQKNSQRPGTSEQTPEQQSVGHGRERLADVEKRPEGRTLRRYGARTVSEEAETVGQRILRSLHMESADEKKTEQPNSTLEELSVDENEMDSIDLDTVQILDRLLDSAGMEGVVRNAGEGALGESTVGEDSPIQSSKNEISDSELRPSVSAAEHSVASDVGDNSSVLEKTKRHGRLSDLKETPVAPDIQSHLRRIRSQLEEKGFGTRKLCIAGVAAVFAIAVLVIFLIAIGHTMSLSKKMENVTADAGLIITVESQPEEWCSSGELKLKVNVKSGTISSIEIDGTAYEADEKGYVTVNAADYLTEVVVVTDEETLTAQIEIPMVDSTAPVVSVDKSQGKITVTASDARSGVASIWYAVIEEDDWIQLPVYQSYSEPIPYEESKTYYFCATDQAGNTSSPIVTNMVTAEALTLSETELALFPGETATLTVEVAPANAYVTELRYESSNTDVVTVNSTGLVTAVAEGGALIRVTADNLETVTCSVTVSSEQTVSISVIGDCTLGTYVGANTSTSFDAYYSIYGATYFFENVRDILENDDITFANLEGTLTDETTPEDKTYAFKGDPSYTEILLDGSIEVVTLANNHSSDYGAQSLVDTENNLTAAGIEYCIGDAIAYKEISGVKIAFIGIYELASGMGCETQVRETIARAQSENAQLIIVAFHWGTEKETSADETQQSLAHIAIDCGADLVVGHHPHVLQGIEKYNGKYIVYSLGNFCFGGNSNPSDKATMIFRQTFTVSSEGAAEDDNIEIIPCTLSSQISYNDYRPTPATGTTAAEIMERINEYSAEFGDITYTASTGL